MANVLINGIAAKSGGGKSILFNFLNLLHSYSCQDQFIVVVPENEYEAFSKDNIRIITIKPSLQNLITYYIHTIKQIVSKYGVSIIFNLADLIVPVSTKQVYLFDWPYAIYPESIAWKKMNLREKLFRKIKLFLIRRYMHLPVLFIAQTNVSEKRLKHYYSINSVEVLPNAVSLENLSGGQYKDFNLPAERFKLLYLTKYYSHKNIEIFIALGEIIREEGLPYSLIITINESQGSKAKKILEELKTKKLDNVVVNVGPVEMKNVPSLYQQTDALLMPTLLESFSGTYVEAMYHRKPIFTSNLDFAKVVCGEAAFYFDPLSASSIIESIKTAFESPELVLTKVRLGSERLNGFLSWPQAFEEYMKIIRRYQ